LKEAAEEYKNRAVSKEEHETQIARLASEAKHAVR